MAPEFTLYLTEAGSILLEDGKFVAAESGSPSSLIDRAKRMGAKSLKVSDPAVAAAVKAAGLETEAFSSGEREGLDTRKIALMVESKLAADELAAIQLIRTKSISAAEDAIRMASSRPDLHLVNAILALDDTDKFLNITATRVTEWYGLHFPELTQMMQDNMALCKMVADIGRREDFDKENLQGRGLTEKKIEAILTAKERSKGGEVAERDLDRVRNLARLALSLGGERDHLNTYVESTMKRIAPNVAEVAGPTIGARLMAKAGGLDRLAVLPASTIQILGAEKALFRALKTGARPPKHGILFQHQDVHMAPKWQRGKIARTLANKIAIAARIDYYRGSGEPSVKVDLERRLEQIRSKYKEPPRKPAGRMKRRR